MQPVVDRLLVDNMRILALADHIAATLARPSTKTHLEELSFEIIDFNDRVLRKHLYRQDEAVFAVLRGLEHGPAPQIAAADAATQRIEAQLLAMRRAVELGEPLRQALESTELALRAYVEQNETDVLPAIDAVLTGDVLVAVEARMQEIDGPEAINDPVTTAIFKDLEAEA